MRVDLNSRLNYINFNGKKKSYPISQNNNILNEGDTQTPEIKKIYTVPLIEVLEFHPVRVLAGSVPDGGSGDGDDSSRGHSSGDDNSGSAGGDSYAKPNIFTMPDYTWDDDL